MKCSSSLPLHLNRDVPSGITPLPWVALILPQRFVLPDLQNLHSPHSGVLKETALSAVLHLESARREVHTRERRHCLQASRWSHLHQRTRRYQRPHDRGLWGRPPLDLFRRVCTHLPLLSSSSASNGTVTHTRMADPGIVYFYANLVRFGCFDFDFFNGEVFACFPSYGSLKSVSCMLPCFHLKSCALCR